MPPASPHLFSGGVAATVPNKYLPQVQSGSRRLLGDGRSLDVVLELRATCTCISPVGSPSGSGVDSAQDGAIPEAAAALGSASASADPRGSAHRCPPGNVFGRVQGSVHRAGGGRGWAGPRSCLGTQVQPRDRQQGRGGCPETASKTCSPVGRATGLAVVHRPRVVALQPGALPPAPQQLRGPGRSVGSEPLVLLVLKRRDRRGGFPPPRLPLVSVSPCKRRGGTSPTVCENPDGVTARETVAVLEGEATLRQAALALARPHRAGGGYRVSWLLGTWGAEARGRHVGVSGRVAAGSARAFCCTYGWLSRSIKRCLFQSQLGWSC